MYLITPSLLNSWQYCIDNGTIEDFLKVLNREPTEKTEAKIKGDEFEKWAIENVPELKGGIYQYATSKHFGNYLLYAKIDILKAGIAYDAKYTDNYEVGKYYGNYQTPIYFELVPEIHKVIYVIGTHGYEDGATLYREEYTRQECEPMNVILRHFETWLRETGHYRVFTEKWRAKEYADNQC